ncbi:MAG: glycosyltransferase family 4 protein [Cyanobacteria bacterium P01_F01_bin.150]
MGYHIVLRQNQDLENLRQEVQAKARPMPEFFLLQDKLDAHIHQPNVDATYRDNLTAIFEGNPSSWSLARKLAKELTQDDVVFCASEDMAIPLASMFLGKKNRPKIISLFYNVVRPRGLVSTKLFRIAQNIDLFLVITAYQGEFLQKYLNIPEERVQFLWHKVDLDFFTPGPMSKAKTSPLLASAGLETRDYRLVAAATQAMDVDVRICAASEHAKRLKRSFPAKIPENMLHQYYSMKDLIQLYRDADIVIVSTFESNQSAGSTSLIEAMACKRPVIVTKNKGIVNYLDPNAMHIVELGDVEGMKSAINDFLDHPDKATEYAERAYEIAKERHTVKDFVKTVSKQMLRLSHA